MRVKSIELCENGQNEPLGASLLAGRANTQPGGNHPILHKSRPCSIKTRQITKCFLSVPEKEVKVKAKLLAFYFCWQLAGKQFCAPSSISLVLQYDIII